MAQAAQQAHVPYTLGTVGGITIERAAELAPDVLWFQLYRMCVRARSSSGSAAASSRPGRA
jgi:isopentenyl diphosphate isomerase/L-lactate dehydrogenase-like FMN-dependent dehydrogenase